MRVVDLDAQSRLRWLNSMPREQRINGPVRFGILANGEVSLGLGSMSPHSFQIPLCCRYVVWRWVAGDRGYGTWKQKSQQAPS
jgi:hypothetical protein